MITALLCIVAYILCGYVCIYIIAKIDKRAPSEHNELMASLFLWPLLLVIGVISLFFYYIPRWIAGCK